METYLPQRSTLQENAGIQVRAAITAEEDISDSASSFSNTDEYILSYKYTLNPMCLHASGRQLAKDRVHMGFAAGR